LRIPDSCIAVASAMTTARSGSPRSQATPAIVAALAACSAVIVIADPGSAQVGACSGGGGAAPSARQASAIRTTTATSPAGHHCWAPRLEPGARAGRRRAFVLPRRRTGRFALRAPAACTVVVRGAVIGTDCKGRCCQFRGAGDHVGEAQRVSRSGRRR
jgi:hypothetical protein